MNNIWILFVMALMIGCKKEQPVAPVDSAEDHTKYTEEQKTITSYADFAKSARQLSTRIGPMSVFDFAVAKTHDDFDKKVGELLDAYSLIQDSSSSQLNVDATNIVTLAKMIQDYKRQQDSSGTGDIKDLVETIKLENTTIDSFQRNYAARSGSIKDSPR